MARYVKLEDVISYLPRYIPPADVVEREKINKAIEEIEKQEKLIIEYEGESDLGIAIKIIREYLGEAE